MKRLLPLTFSVLILIIIFSRINLADFGNYIASLDIPLFAAALLCFIPQVLISAWRWKFLIRKKASLGLFESVKLVLASSSLNVFLPSKIGDLSKAYFLKKQGKIELKRGTNVVLFERYIDTASLCSMAVLGILTEGSFSRHFLILLGISCGVIALFPVLYFLKFEKEPKFSFGGKHPWMEKLRHFLKDAQEYLLELKKDQKTLWLAIAASVFLWSLHLFQFYLVFLAIHAPVAWYHVFCFVPVSILIGMIPITLAGIGSRDAALILLFAPYAPASQMIFIGIFASLRYFIPGICGIPFLHQYMIEEHAE